ncbi:MAG: hypothetical protein IMZ67_10010, partial [Acidobacteria bacterium]|nr:hypothetical protein [Acidobacteriota bacterium]
MRHEVGIRIVVEQLAGGKLSEHVALEESVTPAEIIGQPVRLANVPLSVKPTAEQIQRGPLPETMLQWAKTERVWLPLLTVGARNIAQKVVATTGELTRLPVKSSNPVSGAATGQSVSSMSGFLGGEEAPAPKAAEVEGAPDGELTAEWIEYEIRVPGQPPRNVRREVFDVIGPEARQTGSVPGRLTDADRARRATSLLTHTEAVLLAGRLSIEYVEWIRARALLTNQKWLTRLLRQPGQDPARVMFETIPGLTPLPGPEFDLAVARDDWSPVADATYLAEPNILAFHRGVSEGAGGALAAFNAYDIVWNQVAVMPPRRSESYGLRVRQGTLDSIAEEILIAGPCCGPDGSSPITTLPALGMPGAGWRLVRSADDTRNLQVPAATRARIAADVAGGFTVVAPTAAAAGPIVWWRIDKVTGQTLAIGDRGWGLGGPLGERTVLDWARE